MVFVCAGAVVWLQGQVVWQVVPILLILVQDVQDGCAGQVARHQALTAQIEKAKVFVPMALDPEQLQLQLQQDKDMLST